MKKLKRRIIKEVKNGAGFTLVELLVVSGIFIVVMTIILSILFIIFRGTKKSDSVITVRQNGEQAMAQMVRIMRFVKSLDYPVSCDGTTKDHVIVTAADATQTVYTFTCPAVFVAPNYIDMNGTKLTNDANVIVESCSFVCTQQSGGSPTIGIVFRLSKRNLSSLPEGNTRIQFKNSVTLRNIGG